MTDSPARVTFRGTFCVAGYCSLERTTPFGKEIELAAAGDDVLRPEEFANRAYIVVDADGKIAYRQVMDSPAKALNTEQLLKAIQE